MHKWPVLEDSSTPMRLWITEHGGRVEDYRARRTRMWTSGQKLKTNPKFHL